MLNQPGSYSERGGGMKKRLSPEIFEIPVKQIRSGFFTDAYFNRTRDILVRDNNRTRVVMQVFVRDSGILCGIDEAIAVLKLCAGGPLRVSALHDGDTVAKDDTVLLIEGEYADFAHLETVYLGVLSRGTSVATAVRETVDAAEGKTVLFFASRFDHYSVQAADGYASLIGGADGVSTDANGLYLAAQGIGTIPHGLIAAYNGNTLKACKAFKRHMPDDVDLIALVDFDNDCIGTSLAAARHFGKELWGVRLDTAGDMRDISVTKADSFGVCPELVTLLREALDAEGFGRVKIIVSGGFNPEKIGRFVRLDVPFDGVGVGSAFFRKRIDFTADVVLVDGKPCAKAGREYRSNPGLEEV